MISSGVSTLTGFGNLAGSQFDLVHAPVNRLFAYQVGVGASNVNEAFGNGGWFIAEGDLVVDGEVFPDLTVSGDFAFDAECCPSFEIERTWVATDCSGNTSEVATQTITFENLDDDGGTDSVFNASFFDDFKSNSNTLESGLIGSTGAGITLSDIIPNPASEQATFSFVLNRPMRVMIEIVDLNGNIAHKVFEGDASSDFEHVHQIQTRNMTNGVYYVRIIAEEEMSFTKLVVVN